MTARPNRKPTHGGARVGAGRKSDPNKKRPLSVWVSPEVLAYLATVENKSLAVEHAIRALPDFPPSP